MTLGLQSTGARSTAIETFDWEGTPPRDEFHWISEVNKASMILNTKDGLLDKDAVKKYAQGLVNVIARGNTPGNARPKMYIHYEPLLVKECGMEVTTVHAGRSSQDIHSTFQRTMLRDSVYAMSEAMISVRRALLKLAVDNRDTIAPCYTNGVAAQPNSMAHTWLGHLAGFARDFDAIREFVARLNLSPMGTTVLNGTSWPLNRRDMATYLGFDGIVDNAYDAAQISATDMAVEAAVKLVSPMLHVTQFLQDVMVQYAQPRPWILVSSTYASSAMPQKRNPGSLIDVRRDANTVLGNLTNVLWRAHDLQPGMYDAKDQKLNTEMVNDATSTLNDFAAVLGLLKVDAERALEELNLDWTASQELADILMRRFGIPFRIGHHFSSRMVTVARENKWNPKTFPYARACEIYKEEIKDEGSDSLPQALPLTEAEFYRALDPRDIVNNRQTEGGPQAGELDRQLKECEAGIEMDRQWLEMRKDQLRRSATQLDADFAALME